jgi:hypothetical protein
MIGGRMEDDGEDMAAKRRAQTKSLQGRRKQRRGHQYVENERSIQPNRVTEAINLIKKKQNLTTIEGVANLVGLNWRVIYRIKERHTVLPVDLRYLERWVELSGRPVGYLTGQWSLEGWD